MTTATPSLRNMDCLFDRYLHVHDDDFWLLTLDPRGERWQVVMYDKANLIVDWQSLKLQRLAEHPDGMGYR
jgi:hypothetical protein